MKIGLVTNLVHIEKFIKTRLFEANSEEWMTATGGNTGNVAFVEGIQNIIDNDIGIVYWGDDPKAVNKYYDHIVVCCANQIGSHVDLAGWADRLRHFDLPTTFIGLGAQSDAIGTIPEIPAGSKKFLELTRALRINESQSNVITRGNFSSEVLEHYGVDSSPFGCPSQFISLQNGLGQRCYQHQQRTQFDRIMTAAGNPWHPSSSLESVLTEIVENNRGDYILQHPETLIQLAIGETENIEPNKVKRLEQVYSRIGNWTSIKRWFESFGVFFADAQNWMHYSRHFTLAIGPRYHGVALPIQAGVPGKVICIDSRTEELAVTTGIPVIHYKEVEKMDAESLIKACRWTMDDAANYDQVRKDNVSNYLEFLDANKLAANPDMQTLAKARI